LGEFFNEDQIFGAILFFGGIALLSWCARVERVEKAKMRDPKLKWAYLDADGKLRGEVKKMKIRSIIVNIVGVSMGIFGILSVVWNVKDSNSTDNNTPGVIESLQERHD
jgi:hypothetical protein